MYHAHSVNFNCTHRKNRIDYSVLEAAGPIRPDLDDWIGKFALFILGPIHLVLSLWMLVEYFAVNWPNFVLPRYIYRIP